MSPVNFEARFVLGGFNDSNVFFFFRFGLRHTPLTADKSFMRLRYPVRSLDALYDLLMIKSHMSGYASTADFAFRLFFALLFGSTE
jgi:hypothetical protein